MASRVAIVAMGDMGAGVAARLVERGATVMTVLAGRSAASARRAEKAGVRVLASDEALVGESEMLLAILPPAQAAALAERFRPVIARLAPTLLYVDCNAIAPATVQRIAAPFAQAGLPFADAGIIGGPPRPGDAGPRVYVSGAEAGRLDPLRALGLDIRVLSATIGEASALKMSYAGITKGLQAVGAAMVMGAAQAGVAESFAAELASSQPALFAWLTRQLPGLVPKAYRWVGEMEEIGRFLGDEPGSAAIYDGAARLYEAIAADRERGAAAVRIPLLDAFAARKS